MTAPTPPPMLHYAIYTEHGCGRFDVVTDHRIDFENLPKWVEFKEYHINVEKYYWDTALRTIWVHTKNIDVIKFIGYIKAPLGEVRE